MKASMRMVIEVIIEDDHDTAIAFQEWALKNRILSCGASSVYAGGLSYYFAREHWTTIRKWFTARGDETQGTTCTADEAHGFVWKR